MKLATNTTFKDNARQEDFARIVRTFEKVEVTCCDELAHLINAGYAFCAQHKNNYKIPIWRCFWAETSDFVF